MVKFILFTVTVVKNTLSDGLSFWIFLIDRWVVKITSVGPLMVKITFSDLLMVKIARID